MIGDEDFGVLESLTWGGYKAVEWCRMVWKSEYEEIR